MSAYKTYPALPGPREEPGEGLRRDVMLEAGRAWVAARKDWYGASNVKRKERYEELMRCENALQKTIEEANDEHAG